MKNANAPWCIGKEDLKFAPAPIQFSNAQCPLLSNSQSPFLNFLIS